MQSTTEEKIAIKTAAVTILLNFALTAFKLVAGIIGNSLAMISDAIHSASDVFSTVIVVIGVKIAARAADKSHPFGHERYECVAAIILAAVLFGTGAVIGYGGVTTIVDGSYADAQTPGVVALVAAVVSIAVKEGMFWYTRATAKKINSGALKADAWHHRSDALSSVGSLVGVLGARLGLPIFDPIASLVICLFIFKASVDIFIDAINKMTDKACDDKTENELREFIASCEGVLNVDSLMTRLFGNRIYVIAEIACDGGLELRSAHKIAERVHHGLEESFPLIKHVTVHVNPYGEADEPEGEGQENERRSE